MGSEILVYLRLGFEHISDLNGYDHLLFLAALCAVYQLKQWRHLLWLVTAFTIGHTITLALATLDLVRINDHLVEVLIPCTIVLTCVINVLERTKDQQRPLELGKYAITMGFGLIHGLGFSNFLRVVLGQEESIAVPLLSFNVGLEVGQIMIVLIVLVISFLVARFLRTKPREWTLVVSSAAGALAIQMVIQRLSL